MKKFELIKKRFLNQTLWSGGTTTQLAIYPPKALYGEQEFIWRLSTATVAIEKSVFTHLPDYNRILAILEGRLELCHNQGESIILKRFDQNSFDGDYKTESIGKVRDFNLMMRKGRAKGRIEAIVLNQSSKVSLFENVALVPEQCHGKAIYCYKKDVYVQVIYEGQKEEFYLEEGDLLVIYESQGNKNTKYIIENKNDCNGDLIIADIIYNL